MLFSFKQWMLNEVFGSFNYKIPNDKERQLYDFYMLSYLKSFGEFSSRKIDFSKSYGQDISSYSVIRPDKDIMDEEDKINYMLQEAANVLLPFLRENLLDAVFYSLCSEFKYLFDLNSKQSLIELSKKLGEEYREGILYFLSSDINRKNNLKKNKEIILSAFSSELKAVKVMKFFYENAKWVESYGGKQWAKICDGWLGLESAKSEKDLIIWIDHIYDLQHNTGTVLNKNDSYEKNGSYVWITKALDFKAKLTNPYEMINKVSPSFRNLCIRAIKNKTGESLEQFENSELGKKTNQDERGNEDIQIAKIMHRLKKIRIKNMKLKFEDFGNIDMDTMIARYLKKDTEFTIKNYMLGPNRNQKVKKVKFTLEDLEIETSNKKIEEIKKIIEKENANENLLINANDLFSIVEQDFNISKRTVQILLNKYKNCLFKISETQLESIKEDFSKIKDNKKLIHTVIPTISKLLNIQYKAAQSYTVLLYLRYLNSEVVQNV